MTKIEFKYTTAIHKMRKLNKGIKVIQGGSSAGKTWGIIPILIDKAIKQPGLEISIVSETIPHLRRGALKDFLKIMKLTGRYIDKNYNKTMLKYTFSNGSYIEFFSADDDSKLRGARRDILYINECNNVAFESYTELAIRTQGEKWLDYNPTAKFWVHKELIGLPDVDFIILSYMDNEALPPNVLKDFEIAKEKAKNSTYWKNWCDVYIDGKIGKLEGTIFNDWEFINIKPERFKNYVYGVDFGFTHKMSLVKVWYHEDEIFIEPLIYEAGLTANAMIARFNGLNIDKKADMLCDWSRPEMISDLQLAGYNAMNADKKVLAGINAVNEAKVYAKEDEGLRFEYENYKWKKINDELVDEPVKINDEHMDAIRYAVIYIKDNFINYQPFKTF
jgi:phage terminase large subunit